MRKALGNTSAISPIIATLLLIIIAIAAGVVIYAYVAGFIGDSTQNSGLVQEEVSIDAACVSLSSGCNGGAYYIVVRNVGNTLTYPAGSTIQIYFTDSSTTATGTKTCSVSTISGGSSLTCSGASGSLNGVFTTSQGDTDQIKIVMPNGGVATYAVKAAS
jgi:FlaG/FlaF family flagellin (archaellin)